MIIPIEPRILSRYLNRDGPFIYFFIGKGENNITIKKIIYEFSQQYSLLKIFEIDFEKYRKIFVNTTESDMNRIYLYANGLLIEDKYLPNENAILEIFKKAIEFHNQNMDNRAWKQGKNSLINTDTNISSYKNISKTYRRCLSVVNCKKRKFLKQKYISLCKNISADDEHNLKCNILNMKNIEFNSKPINFNIESITKQNKTILSYPQFKLNYNEQYVKNDKKIDINSNSNIYAKSYTDTFDVTNHIDSNFQSEFKKKLPLKYVKKCKNSSTTGIKVKFNKRMSRSVLIENSRDKT